MNRKAEKNGCFPYSNNKKKRTAETAQLWRQGNQPKECYNPQPSVQKLNYIHNNPVDAGIVEKADYLYSSARSYEQKESGLLEVQIL
jgi:hypothetical protein